MTKDKFWTMVYKRDLEEMVDLKRRNLPNEKEIIAGWKKWDYMLVDYFGPERCEKETLITDPEEIASIVGYTREELEREADEIVRAERECLKKAKEKLNEKKQKLKEIENEQVPYSWIDYWWDLYPWTVTAKQRKIYDEEDMEERAKASWECWKAAREYNLKYRWLERKYRLHPPPTPSRPSSPGTRKASWRGWIRRLLTS